MRIFVAMILAVRARGCRRASHQNFHGPRAALVQTEARMEWPEPSARYNAFPSGHTAASDRILRNACFRQLADWRSPSSSSRC